VLAGLARRGLTEGAGSPSVAVASRTDRKVSARANAMALASPLGAEPLLRRLNSISPWIFFTAAAEVSPDFRVRAARRRVYRYYEPGPLGDRREWAASARLFESRIDVRSLGRGLPSRSPVWRTVESLTSIEVEGGRVVEVRAPSFVWGMVRKIVGALREVADGRLSRARLAAALAGELRLTLPMAEPEGLVLWAVEYASVRWEEEWSGPNRHQARYFGSSLADLWRRREVMGALHGLGPD
jgi:tRNA pseudouridine38-40 synthase